MMGPSESSIRRVLMAATLLPRLVLATYTTAVFLSAFQVFAVQPENIGTLAQEETWVLTEPDPALRTWTDDYSNIFGAFRHKLMP